MGWLGLLILGVGLLIGRPVLAEAVCAQVKIEIQQELTLERQAFDAMMRINNGLDTLPIENVDITVSFEDEDGNTVLATTETSEPSDPNIKFFIRLDTMDNIDNVSGSGRVAPNTTAEIHWLIIPTPGAAEDLPGGKLFFVGARLSYTLGGVPESVEVTPDFITVKPLPRLTLDYFLTQEVVGDDAFTPEIEPSEPYTLGVRVKNDGIVAANHLKIDSAQPKITEDGNPQGLAIGFQILGSSIDDQPAAPNLLIDFGAVDGNSARVGRWQMTSSLSGEFIGFDVTFTHADELGGQLTSILQATNGHFLIRDVRVDLPGRDNVRDFLAKDGDIYRVYESEGLDTDVINASAQANLSVLDTQATYTDYRLTVPAAAGFSYVQLPDPQGGAYQVISATRADGKAMSTDNVWTSRSRNRDTNPPSWHYHLNLFDVDSTGSYTVRLGPTVTGPEPPVIAFLPDRSTTINTAMGFLVEASDPNGDPITLSTSPLPAGAAFIDNGDGTAYLNWTPINGQAGSYIVRVTASDGSLESSRLMTITVNGDGDSDGDGMDDDWELAWFETLARDGTGDYDGDGISDLSEFQNDTDPARAPGPGQPEPLLPLYGAEVDHLDPVLTVQNGQHSLAQMVSYHFEVYRDAELYELIASSGAVIEDASGETAWAITATLDDNTRYYWRVRAHDGVTYSEWARGEFFVNPVNDPPSAPQISWPQYGGHVPAMAPRLEVIASADPDRDTLSYSIQLFEDFALTLPVSEPWRIYPDPQSPSIIRWQGALEDVGLVEGATYYWVAIVTDEHGESAQSLASTFTVDTLNRVLPAPVLVTPTDGAEVSSTEIDLIVNAVVDPEGHPVYYHFELDTVDTFDSPDHVVHQQILATGSTATWQPPVLNDNTRYYWRARAYGGLNGSQWVNGQFFVNTANDVPPVPLPGNLDVAGWSGTLAPTLYLAPAEDIDGDTQRYDFELYAYSRASGVGSLLASAQTTEPLLDLQTLAPLATEYTWLAWRARAIDEHDAASDWMTPVPLFIDNVTVPETLTLDAPVDLTVAEGASTTVDLTTFGVSAPVCLRPVDALPVFAQLTDLGNGQATLTLNPDYQTAGTHTLTVIAGHRGTVCGDDRRMVPFAPVTHTFAITIGETNRAPVIEDPSNIVVAEGDALSLSIVATDPDGDGQTLTYSALGLPSGLSINPTTGTISGTPTFDAAGTYNVTVTVTDDGVPSLNAQASFNLDVTNTNRAPVMPSQADTTVAEGSAVSLSLTATDPDNDNLSYGATGLPAGLAIDNVTGVISGTPTFDAAGTYSITVTVTDDGVPSLNAQATFNLDVTNTNRAPVIPTQADTTVAEGSAVSLSLAATDPDNDNLSYGATGLPTGLTIDSITSVISGTPTFDAAGTYSITVTVTDDGVPSLNAQATFNLDVTNTNRAPVIPTQADTTVAEGSAVSLSLAATDPDNDNLSYGATGLPAGLTINSATGVINGTPTFDAAGTYNVTVTATDDGVPSLNAQATFNLDVTSTNRAPVMTSPSTLSTTEGLPFELTLQATDPDGDTLSFTAEGLPAGLILNATTGVISGSSSIGSAGNHQITFTVSDNGTPSLYDTNAVYLTVLVNPDSDSDGMDDDWELAWFETLARDGTGDYDGDGISDLSEFQNDTDPARAPGPGQPEPLLPLYGAEVDHLDPVLTVQNGQHSLAQMVSYHFEVYRDAELYELIASSGAVIEDASGETAWAITATLDDNTHYYWRVRAHDGATYSEWARGQFFVNTVNDPPSVPKINWPADGGRMPAMSPALIVTNSTDPDPDQEELYYSVQLFEDAALTLPINEPWGRYADPQSSGITWWQQEIEDIELVEGATYYWVVTVTDEQGTSVQSPVAQFTVDGINNAPPEPTLVTPASGVELASAELDLVVGAVVDPDGDTVQYRFELDTVTTFDSLDKLVSEPLLAAGGNVTWLLPILNDNTRYYWRVQATDGLTDSRWVNGHFFVNTTNDVPPVPVPGNLDVAGWSGTLTPTLYLAPAEDIDGDTQRYDFELYAYSRASGVGSLLASAQSTVPQLDLQTLAPLATEYTWLAWRARAIDEHDAASDWMAPVPIFVDDVTVSETLGIDAPTQITVDEGATVTVDMMAVGVSTPVCFKVADWPLEFGTLTDLGNGRARLTLSPNYWRYGTYSLDVVAGHRGTLCGGDLRTAPFAPVTHRFDITVNDTNRAPVITPHADVVAAEGETLSLSIIATDPDGDGPVLTYSATGLPPGLMIDSVFLGGEHINEVGMITGTLTYDAAGTYNVTVDVVDNGVPPLSAQTSFTLEVTNTNRAPVLANPGTLTATEGQLFELYLYTTDPDEDTLSFTAEGLPAGLVLDSASGMVSGLPAAGSAGDYTITVSVSDNGTPSLGDSLTFDLVVVSAAWNPPPTIWVVYPQDGAWYPLGAAVHFEAETFDQNGSVVDVTYYANGLPVGSAASAPHAVDWTPTTSGTYTITAVATDNEGATATFSARTIEVVDAEGRAVAEAYYVLNPRMSLGDAHVVSLEDNNLIRVGATQLSLNRYERGTLPAAELTQGAIVTGTGAFDIGSDVDATDVPLSYRLAGKSFAVPQNNVGNRYYLLSPYGDAQVEIQVGINAQTTSLVLPKNEVIEYDDNTLGHNAALINADLPIIVSRAGLEKGEVSRDAIPISPASMELWGMTGNSLLVGALEDDTVVTVVEHDDYRMWIKFLSAGEAANMLADSGSQGATGGVRVRANKPIGAIMDSDGDGNDQAVLLPTEQLRTRFGIPEDTQYVAVTCSQKNTQVTLYVPGQPPQVQICDIDFVAPPYLPSGFVRFNPGHVYFGDAVNGPHIPAGSYLEGEVPIAVTYEPAASNDEHNLMGTNTIKETYYVMNPRMSLGDASVVSLEDNNLIQVGSTQLQLDRYERGLLPAAELTQGAVITGSKAFDIGSEVNGTDVPVSQRFTGTRFVMPQGSYVRRYYLMSPYGDAQAHVYAGEHATHPDPTTLSLPQGQVIQYDAVENSGAIRVLADEPIVVSHIVDSTSGEAMPIPPAAKELWGLRSSNAMVGALEHGTLVDIYADDGTWLQGLSLSVGEFSVIDVGQNAAHGMGSALRLVANKPIGAVQSSDGDGEERTAFFPTAYLGMNFGIPVDTQYVAITCTNAQTQITLHVPGQTSQVAVCNSDGDHPGHVYFGETTSGAHIPVGAYLESTAPVHVVYEAAASEGENNLMGTIPAMPAQTIAIGD